jgi:hypothetical protein
LTFSNVDWNVPQNVTVTGQDDPEVDGAQNYILTVSVDDANSDDAYDPVPDQTVTGTNTDDDVAGTPGMTLSKNVVATSEPNGADSFTVVLNQQPATDVVIDISSNDTGEAVPTPALLTFSNVDWNVPQNVTVTGQDDPEVDGAQNFALTVSVNDAASDDAYDVLSDQVVNGTNADDDVPPNSIPLINQEDLRLFVTNATCPGVNNGEIRISVLANYMFNVSLNGLELEERVSPVSDVELNNLETGIYDVCLSLPAFPGWQQCFTATITNFENLVAEVLSIDSINNSALITLQGSLTYEVNVNEVGYRYDFNDISSKTIQVPLEQGVNLINIKGQFACQGIFSQIVNTPNLIFYPNPVIDEMTVEGLGNSSLTDYHIHNSSGVLVLKESNLNNSEKLKINMENLSSGWYYLKFRGPKEVLEYKIIKK